MADTVVAVFDAYDRAQRAWDTLSMHGFSNADLRLAPEATDDDSREDVRRSARENGGMLGFFRALFGTDDGAQHVERYGDAIHRGHYVFSVSARDEDEARRAADVLRRCGALSVDLHGAIPPHGAHAGAPGGMDAAGMEDGGVWSPDDTDVDIAQERGRHAGNDLMTGAGRPLDADTRRDRPLPK